MFFDTLTYFLNTLNISQYIQQSLQPHLLHDVADAPCLHTLVKCQCLAWFRNLAKCFLVRKVSLLNDAKGYGLGYWKK